MKNYIFLFLSIFSLSGASLQHYSYVNSAADNALLQGLIRLKDSRVIDLKRDCVKGDIIDGKVHVFYSLPQLNIILRYVCEFEDNAQCGFLGEISCFHNMDDAQKFYGSTIGHISFMRKNSDEAYINFIEINDLFRGQGLGTIIFKAAIQFIENENMCKQIRLIVMNGPKNLAAIKMYENHGFKWRYPESFETAEMIKSIKSKL